MILILPKILIFGNNKSESNQFNRFASSSSLLYLLYMILRYILHMYVKEKHFDSGYLVTWWIFVRLTGIASNFARLYP